MNKTLGYIAFSLLLILMIMMGIATLHEHFSGTEFALKFYYKTVWFNLLWAWLAVTGGYYIIKSGLFKKKSAFLLHASLLIIIIGAMFTRFSGKTGMIHLREGIEVNSFSCEEANHPLRLPFTIELEAFDIHYYPGTSSPSDYQSSVTVRDKHSDEVVKKTISMNNILNFKGYRFYQSSFDEDQKGSFLSINHDPIGIPLTYTGYYLLFFSMLWVLFDKKGKFFELCKKTFNSSKTTAYKSKKNISRSLLLLALFLFSSFSSEASRSDFEKIVTNQEQATQFSNILVNYHGRICPIGTLASDYTTKLIGKSNYKGLEPEQFLLGWIIYNEEWKSIPIFKINHPDLKKLINVSGEACLNDFFDPVGEYKLALFWKQMHGSDQTSILKEASKLDEKIQLISMLLNGSLLEVFPFKTSNGQIKWFSHTSTLPENADEMQQTLVDNFFKAYSDIIHKEDKSEASSLVDILIKYQKKMLGEAYPSKMHLKAESIYNKIPIFSILFKIALVIGCFGMIIFILFTIKNKKSGRYHTITYVSLILLFVVSTLWIALRGYIAGRLPMSNGYETMLVVSWTALLIGVLIHRTSFLITNFSLLLSGFALLVAHIGSMNPQITPLVPVLQSPLLSIHVSLIMLAYGLCGFMVLNSLTAFTLSIFQSNKQKHALQVIRLKELSELFMYPATFLMGAGIFVGAIWANVSWGRYWGWDPKEVWALITFLLMSFSFHSQTMKWFRKPYIYHLFVVVVFLAVLMTYFGVNYILGGKHSYAG